MKCRSDCLIAYASVLRFSIKFLNDIQMYFAEKSRPLSGEISDTSVHFEVCMYVHTYVRMYV